MSKTYISGTRRSGIMLLVLFGPDGIDGHCSIDPEVLNLILKLNPDESITFRDEQLITWEVKLGNRSEYLYFESKGSHGLKGQIPTLSIN